MVSRKAFGGGASVLLFFCDFLWVFRRALMWQGLCAHSCRFTVAYRFI